MQQAVYLFTNGVPFDVAFSLDDPMRIGLTILIAQQSSGQEFNFKTWKYEDKKQK